MIAIVAASLASFVVGVVVGVLFDDARELAQHGHTRAMARYSRLATSWLNRPSTPATRRVEIGLVLTALAAQALVGFATIQNGRHDDDRSLCTINYNRLDGKARDERAKVAAGQVDSEIALWKRLRDQLANGTATRGSLTEPIDEHLRALEAVKNARLANPYPPVDFCGPGTTASR